MASQANERSSASGGASAGSHSGKTGSERHCFDRHDPRTARRLLLAVRASLHNLESDASLNPGQRNLVEGVSLKRAGDGIVLRSPEMDVIGTHTVELGFLPSITCAEGLDLPRGIRVARDRHHVTALRARTDSAASVELVCGRATARDPSLREIIERIVVEKVSLEHFEIGWSRSSHAYERQPGVPTADALARRAAGLGSR